MALITSIRKHFWFVLILLGLALASFVIMDIVGSGGGGGGRGTLTLGEVAGEKISYSEFQNSENVYYNNSGGNIYGVKSAIWNYFVEKSIIEDEAEALGLVVSVDELMDLQFGAKLSPIIEQNWKNPQSNQVNRAKLNEFKVAIEAGQPLNPKFRGFWAEQERQVIKAKLQEKLGNIVSKAIYTPSWLSDQKAALSKDQVKLAYVKIPFASLTNEVSLTDEDYTQFMNAKKSSYLIDEDNRVMDYVVFDVFPTKQDSLIYFESMTDRKLAFQATKDDSLYAVTNNGSYANFYFEVDKLPVSIKDHIPSIETGSTFGPYLENGAYNVVKLVDKKVIADSVHASHILRTVDYTVPGQLEAAMSHIDSVQQLLKTGGSFEEIAKTSSQDPGSGAKGGDLGYFAQGAMVPQFNEAAFYNEGEMHVVRTKFGVHLIKIHDKKFLNEELKYKLAFIRLAITPSDDTQETLYDNVSNLLTENTDLESLKAAASKIGGTFTSATPVKANDFNFANIEAGQTSRDIVRWSFQDDVSVGSLAPEVFTYTDEVNYFNSKYVLVAVTQINDAGMPSVSSMKSILKTQVENKKKADAVASTLGTNMAEAASKYNVKLDTVSNVSFTSSFVSGVGNEPKVLAKAFKMNSGATPVAIVGDNALFLIQVVEQSQGADVANISQFKNNDRNNKRREVGYSLLNSLKKVTDVVDNRSTFY